MRPTKKVLEHKLASLDEVDTPECKATHSLERGRGNPAPSVTGGDYMVRARLNCECRYSTPVRERPLHPTRNHLTPEASQTQTPVTLATEPERRTGGGLTTNLPPSAVALPPTPANFRNSASPLTKLPRQTSARSRRPRGRTREIQPPQSRGHRHFPG